MRWPVATKLEGFAELDKALGQLPKATAKNTLRRVLKKAAAPIDESASALAPVETGKLAQSVIVGTKLTRSQRSGGVSITEGGFRSAAKNYVEVHVGTASPIGIFQEFGTLEHLASPFMRPAWEHNKEQALDIIKSELGTEIEKSAKRYAKKLAKGA
jgi:HK97 gp10 family phage protein